MLKDKAELKKLYNAFKTEPLPAGDVAYVNYAAVRGGRNIETELGDHISWSDNPTCSLFTGHRGCGKSTELLRLQNYLENDGAKVIYFAADEEDIDPEDARYTDILLACTRHLLRELKGNKSTALKDWVRNIWDDIKKLATTEIEFEKVEIDVLFMKLNANLRGNPTMRQQIRDQLEPHTVNLLVALNLFISHLEEIFIDRCEQLKGLACHVVYTVPNSLLYSDKAVHLENAYEKITRLPVIKVREKSTRNEYQEGINAMLELVEQRIKKTSTQTLAQVFGNQEIVKTLCLMSG